jgi:hypothetical protein
MAVRWQQKRGRRFRENPCKSWLWGPRSQLYLVFTWTRALCAAVDPNALLMSLFALSYLGSATAPAACLPRSARAHRLSDPSRALSSAPPCNTEGGYALTESLICTLDCRVSARATGHPCASSAAHRAEDPARHGQRRDIHVFASQCFIIKRPFCKLALYAQPPAARSGRADSGQAGKRQRWLTFRDAFGSPRQLNNYGKYLSKSRRF